MKVHKYNEVDGVNQKVKSPLRYRGLLYIVGIEGDVVNQIQ